MANLAKKRGTVKREAAALTGFGTSCRIENGDEVGIVAPSVRSLERLWRSLNWRDPFDKNLVTRVVYFPRKAATTLRPRKRRTSKPAVKP